jgi:hypothetical protein
MHEDDADHGQMRNLRKERAIDAVREGGATATANCKPALADQSQTTSRTITSPALAP